MLKPVMSLLKCIVEMSFYGVNIGGDNLHSTEAFSHPTKADGNSSALGSGSSCEKGQGWPASCPVTERPEQIFKYTVRDVGQFFAELPKLAALISPAIAAQINCEVLLNGKNRLIEQQVKEVVG